MKVHSHGAAEASFNVWNPLPEETQRDDGLHITSLHYRPQRSWAKVMFLQLCVILFTGRGVCIPACIVGGIPACLAAGLQGGVYPSMHCRRYSSMPCSRSRGGCIPACIAGGIPAAGTHPTEMHSCCKYHPYLYYCYLAKIGHPNATAYAHIV